MLGANTTVYILWIVQRLALWWIGLHFSWRHVNPKSPNKVCWWTLPVNCPWALHPWSCQKTSSCQWFWRMHRHWQGHSRCGLRISHAVSPCCLEEYPLESNNILKQTMSYRGWSRIGCGCSLRMDRRRIHMWWVFGCWCVEYIRH